MPAPDALPSLASRAVLFVAREPDETLRTVLPIVDRLRSAHDVPSRVLFHHTPGAWARAELRRRSVEWREVRAPTSRLPGWARRVTPEPIVRTADEIGHLLWARAVARRVLRKERPSVVVVIQDTLLLERFLVREANHLGIPTLVVQWAFTFPQSLYDRLRVIQFGTRASDHQASRGRLRRALAPLTRAAYQGTLRALGLRFELANTYGGGEARLFAVMGEAFAEQFVAQGARGKRIVVTGHPTHDLAYRRATTMTDRERRAIRERYNLAGDDQLVLYATQPVLWRRVITAADLEANVRVMAGAVAGLGANGRPARLVIKLHPRERPDDYAFCSRLDPPVTVIPAAEMTDLIAAADLFVSSSSSTVLLAMMLDRPIVTVNFNDVPHFDFFASIGGTLHARTYEEFRSAAQRALNDPATRERLARERTAVLDRYTRFDGRATERLAALIAESGGRVTGAR